jgi:hypothetical protein
VKGLVFPAIQAEEGNVVNQDIDSALEGWDYKPANVQARLVQARDGRQIIQMRVDLGILQMETGTRPDGQKPHGQPTYLAYLKEQARVAHKSGHVFVMTEEQCQEADREFLQFYHRRICWLALRNYERAVTDADHSLAFMDFVKKHAPNEEYTLSHEQYRGFVVFHRTQAAAALAIEKNNPESAIDAIHHGLARIRSFYDEHEIEERFDDDVMVQQLRRIQDQIRELHKIETTLQEQLDQAVAKEDYEVAAKIRDAIKKRGR